MKAKTEKRPIMLITDERKVDWWWKMRDGRNIGPRQELVEEIKGESGMDFHMYSSERFLSYGQQYLDEKVNESALNELQAIKKSELELELSSQNKLSEESKVAYIREGKISYYRLLLAELESDLKLVRLRQSILEHREEPENPETQELAHTLGVRKDELEKRLVEIKTKLNRELIRKKFNDTRIEYNDLFESDKKL